MLRFLLVYTSMTGNTESMAESIALSIQENKEIELTQVDIMESTPRNLDDFDGFIIGSYTWGDGDIPDEMLDFYDELEEHDMNEKIAAVFGSGDTSYQDFCGALDHFEEQLKSQGVILLLPSLKVELDPEEEELEACMQFGKDFVNKALAIHS